MSFVEKLRLGKPGKFRHELKYICSQLDVEIVKSRLRDLMPQDTHAGITGLYSVRSLYFDDAYNTCMKENEAGVDDRKKIRIRIYNGSSDRIQLEIKRKYRGMTQKSACPLSQEQCHQLMQGQCLPLHPDDPPELKQLHLLMKTRLLRPVTFVEYERIPFVYPHGNVRITLDTHIAASSHVTRFLDESPLLIPALPAGMEILEVKYDEFLPDIISGTLQLGRLSQTSFSKYYICRSKAPIQTYKKSEG